MPDLDCDYLIVGSGFGGAVCALRLAEKGWRVVVAEQGRRIGQAEIEAGKNSPAKLLWMPELGLRGYFAQHFFKHMGVVAGVGVGGGSLVWAAVMLEAKPAFYEDPVVKRLGLDLKAELAPHYATAKRMLGVVPNPRQTHQDALLRQTAEVMGVGSSHGPVPNAIYFGERGVTAADPYFGGEGPARKGCVYCGGCMTGCESGSKNSLDHNYLHLAERRGARIRAERRADRIEPLPGGGYRVGLRGPDGVETLSARHVVLAGGVVGTLGLLFQNRDGYGTLPGISPTLGQLVRTNSESITAIQHPPGVDMTDGTAISSDFYPDAQTHITQNRFDRGYRFMRLYMGPLVDDPVAWRRALRTLLGIPLSPVLMLRNLFMRDWEQRLTVLTVMQTVDSRVRLRWGRRWWWPFSKMLITDASPGHQAPSYLPIANRATREFARVAGAKPMNLMVESIGSMATTAHPLSGCPMGESVETGVIDTKHEVFGHPGLFVVDASSVPANIGVNPSLTIVAMAERFCALRPSAG